MSSRSSSDHAGSAVLPTGGTAEAVPFPRVQSRKYFPVLRGVHPSTEFVAAFPE